MRAEVERKDKAIKKLIAVGQESAVRSQSSKTSNNDLIEIVNKWKAQSKQTRDWTKANQLLNELEQLIK